MDFTYINKIGVLRRAVLQKKKKKLVTIKCEVT